MKLTTLLKWATVILMMLVLVGGLTTTPGVWPRPVQRTKPRQ